MRREPRTLCPFGLRLKEALERAHLSQVELAGQLYVSDSIVSRWMVGEAEPRLSMLVRICEITGVEIDWLCGMGGESDDDR